MIYSLIKEQNESYGYEIVFNGKSAEECWDYFNKYHKGECMKGYHYEVKEFLE